MLINVWLTTNCNLRCKYCYEGEEKPAMSMTQKTAEECCKFIRSQNDQLLIVQFHGGEPLLNYDLIEFIVKEILSHKKINQKVMFGITTNGVFLTDERILFLAKHMDYGFSISIDGNKQTHDLLRRTTAGEGSYDLIIKNVVSALSISDKIRLRMTFTPETVSSLADNVMYLIMLGGKCIVAHPDYFNNNWTEDHLKTYEMQLDKLKRINKAKGLKKQDIYISLLEYEIFKKTKCTGGYTSINISPEGDFYPCTYVMYIPEYKIGSVYSGINKDQLGRISKINDSEMTDCIGCNNYSSCLSVRCRYLNEQITGSPTKPSPVICAFENKNIMFSI